MPSKEKFPLRVVSLSNRQYPQILAQIADPPKKLYVRGKLPALGLPLLGVVGTRVCTPYGATVTDELVTAATKQGLGIVSGLAYGIDTIAHTSCLKAGGYTIAVLGTGIDDKTIYPASNRTLATQILESGGCLITEYPAGFKATAFSFPMRNRIIAGLSKGTLVTEAPYGSGALITARAALDYNREVLSVPHPITNPKGDGNNQLLKQGAQVVTKVKDILVALNLPILDKRTGNKKPNATGPAAKVVKLLGREPLHIDVIIKTTGLASAVVTGVLTVLEIEGQVKNLGGMRYILK